MSALRLLLLAAYSLPPCLREARGMKEREQGEGARRGGKDREQGEEASKRESGEEGRSAKQERGTGVSAKRGLTQC